MANLLNDSLSFKIGNKNYNGGNNDVKIKDKITSQSVDKRKTNKKISVINNWLK